MEKKFSFGKMKEEITRGMERKVVITHENTTSSLSTKKSIRTSKITDEDK